MTSNKFFFFVKRSTCSRSVSFSFGIFFEGVWYRNWSVREVLSVHGVDSSIRSIKTCKVYKCKSFRCTCFGIPHDLNQFEEEIALKSLKVTKTVNRIMLIININSLKNWFLMSNHFQFIFYLLVNSYLWCL